MLVFFQELFDWKIRLVFPRVTDEVEGFIFGKGILLVRRSCPVKDGPDAGNTV